MGQCSSQKNVNPPKQAKRASDGPRARRKSRATSAASSAGTPKSALVIERHGSTLRRKGGHGTLRRKSRIDKVDEGIIRIVLYGTRDAGKTTVFRQMKLSQGIRLEKKFKHRGYILVTLLTSLIKAVEDASKLLKLTVNTEEFEDSWNILLEERIRCKRNAIDTDGYYFSSKIAKAFTIVYKHKEFKKILKHSSSLNIPDSFEYFCKRLTKNPKYPYFGGPSWIPSNSEYLRASIKSNKKSSLNFEYDGMKYQLIDLGTRKLKKINQITQNSQAILFVASLSEYDQTLYEDKLTNRLTETMNVWSKVVNAKENEHLWFLVFLNKTDLLKKKFWDNEIPVYVDFDVTRPPPEPFEDDEDCMLIMQWFEELFKSRVKPEKRHQVRFYFTNSIQKDNVTQSVEYCASILKHNLARGTNE